MKEKQSADVLGLTFDELKAQMLICDRAMKVLVDAESQKIVFGFMVELQEEVDFRIRQA